MTKEEKQRLKEGKKVAEKRAKLIRKEERKREKQEAREARRREREERRLAKKRGNAPAIVEEEKEEVTAPVAPVEQEKEETDSEAVKERKPSTKKNYHISLREDGKWQVKFAKGARALKLFSTQAEAIAYAKEKAENQDGSITIHKKDGKIRKQNYSKKDQFSSFLILFSAFFFVFEKTKEKSGAKKKEKTFK